MLRRHYACYACYACYARYADLRNHYAKFTQALRSITQSLRSYYAICHVAVYAEITQILRNLRNRYALLRRLRTVTHRYADGNLLMESPFIAASDFIAASRASPKCKSLLITLNPVGMLCFNEPLAPNLPPLLPSHPLP